MILYTDGFDSNNPLGDRRISDKINATYFKIGNFTNEYASTNYMTQAVILATHEQIKKFGYSKIHEPLIKDIKILEEYGIDIENRDQKINLLGTVSFFPADNLAAHAIGGFVECFSQPSIPCCRFCEEIAKISKIRRLKMWKN